MKELHINLLGKLYIQKSLHRLVLQDALSFLFNQMATRTQKKRGQLQRDLGECNFDWRHRGFISSTPCCGTGLDRSHSSAHREHFLNTGRNEEERNQAEAKIAEVTALTVNRNATTWPRPQIDLPCPQSQCDFFSLSEQDINVVQ